MIQQGRPSIITLRPGAAPPAPVELPAPAPPRRALAWLKLAGVFTLSALLLGAGAAAGLARYGGAYTRSAFRTTASSLEIPSGKGDPVERERRMATRVAALAPAGNEVYVVVDTFKNQLRVYRGAKLLREAIVSSGSGVLLRDPRNGKEWIFDTPTGELKILRKTTHPLWIKPDWAFIEDGYEPPKGMRDRVDDFSLGDYALYMRDGYIIHGTIFKTLLGKRVTHGCVRLGDEDLKFVYDNVPVGARVFLY